MVRVLLQERAPNVLFNVNNPKVLDSVLRTNQSISVKIAVKTFVRIVLKGSCAQTRTVAIFTAQTQLAIVCAKSVHAWTFIVPNVWMNTNKHVLLTFENGMEDDAKEEVDKEEDAEGVAEAESQ